MNSLQALPSNGLQYRVSESERIVTYLTNVLYLVTLGCCLTHLVLFWYYDNSGLVLFDVTALMLIGIGWRMNARGHSHGARMLVLIVINAALLVGTSVLRAPIIIHAAIGSCIMLSVIFFSRVNSFYRVASICLLLFSFLLSEVTQYELFPAAVVPEWAAFCLIWSMVASSIFGALIITRSFARMHQDAEKHRQAMLEERETLAQELLENEDALKEHMRALHEAHHEITQREKQYRLISENLHEVVCLHASDGTPTYVSSSIRRLLDYSPGEFLKRSPFELIHPCDLPEVRACVAAFREQPSVVTFHCRLLHRNGDYVWVEVTMTPAHNENGEMEGAQTSTRDIQSRKQLEVLLRQTQTLANAGGYEFDFTTQESVWTDEMYAIHELPHTTDLKKFSFTNHYAKQDADELLNAFERVRTEGHSFDLELPFTSHLGRKRWVRVCGQPVRRSGQIVGVQGIFQDISRAKEREEELFQRQREMAALIEGAPVGIAMFDRRMCYLAASRRWRDTFEITGEVTGQSHYDLLPNLPDEWKTIYRNCLNGEVYQRDEDSFLHADGRQEWLRWVVRPWRDSQGKINGLIILSESITARKQAEARAKRQRRRMAEVYRLTSKRITDLPTHVTTLLQQATEALGMELGVFSEIRDDIFTVRAYHHPPDMPIAVGQTFPFADTYCSLTYQQSGVMAINHMGHSVLAYHPCYRTFKLESYIGVPIWRRGKRYGTISFSSRYPATFTGEDHD
ncbi:MAG: PAS domain S-box protein, partial [Catalinimonas sp.]